jgi:hypothetical protein
MTDPPWSRITNRSHGSSRPHKLFHKDDRCSPRSQFVDNLHHEVEHPR